MKRGKVIKLKQDSAVVAPSLLDRLMDDEHNSPSDSGQFLTAQFRSALLRDLENLLNTRIFHQSDISLYSELGHSLLSYGLPDFSRIQFELEAHRQAFAQQVQETIEHFEPRFAAVQVSIVPVKNTYERILYLRIQASLKTLPEPTPLVFESQVRSLDRAVSVREMPYG